MEPQYRSPHRPISKSTSTCKPSKSVIKRSQYKQQSESKSHISAVKNISEGQPYKNLLNRLLRSENLAKFVREAEKYVELNEEAAAAYKSANVQNERSRKDFQEYGRALLRDGSFIRYYCKLVEREHAEDRKAVREYFYHKYRNEVCIREKMFNDYFKQEIPQQDPLIFSFSKSKPKEKKEAGLSKSKSHKKARTQFSFCMKENNKNGENLSGVAQEQSNQSELTKEQSKTSSKMTKSEKKGKVVHFQKETEEEPGYQEQNYRSPYIKYNPKETQQQRDFRMSGLVKPGSKHKSSERKRNIVTFAEDLKTNHRLRTIYQQLMKEQEEREKLMGDKSTNSTNQPVLRTTATYDITFSEKMTREITEEDREELGQTEKQILSHYPNIHLKAHKTGVKIEAERLEGLYKNYIIKKVFLIDYYHHLEPEYIGIWAKRVTNEDTKDMQPCEFEDDERIKVIIFE